MSKPAQLTVALAYCRDTQVGNVPSLEIQRRDVEAWARRTRTKIARWFVEGSARSRIEERPALAAALCALGPDSRVLCVAVRDALDRDPAVRAVVEHVAKHAGGGVIYAAVRSAPTACPSELDPLLDAHEQMLLRLQLTRAEERKASGAAIWGRVPWGYRLSADGMSLEPNPTERAVVSVARHMRLGGLKLRQIADELKRLGVVSRAGKPLGITRIYELLNQGKGSRPSVLAERLPVDDDVPPESVVRPSLLPGSLSEREKIGPRNLVAWGARRRGRAR